MAEDAKILSLDNMDGVFINKKDNIQGVDLEMLFTVNKIQIEVDKSSKCAEGM